MSKIVWKPGAFEYPIPAVLVTSGTMEKSNIMTVAWTRNYQFKTTYGLCFYKTR